MPKTRNRPITAFPTEDLRERIDSYSRETGVPIAEIVRRALTDYIGSREGRGARAEVSEAKLQR